MNLYHRILSLISVALIANTALAAETKNEELGKVHWLRNYDEALEKANVAKKPILLLFQEVPGCKNCIAYGDTILSHPIIVDAIEESFVPVAIFNNKPSGHDLEILERFNETAWSHQIMRFMDPSGTELIPRKEGVWSPGETAVRLIQALEAYGKTVPDYLATVAWTTNQDDLKTAVFSMHCFWDGESKLGAIDGVVETETGWLDNQKVVRLRYAPAKIKWPNLVEQARAMGCAKNIYAPDVRTIVETPEQFGTFTELYIAEAFRMAQSSDQKRHLQASPYRDLPLNPVQRTKINAALSLKDTTTIAKWLSPSQRTKHM